MRSFVQREGVHKTNIREVELMFKGYGLITIEVTYRRPDYLRILQQFILQDYDLAPKFPRLFGFIDFWKQELDGPLVMVRFSHSQLINPMQWRKVDVEYLQ